MKHRHENSRLIHASFRLGHSLLWACHGITLSLPVHLDAMYEGQRHRGAAGIDRIQPVTRTHLRRPVGRQALF
jgi:hypothetical protein